MTEDQIAAMMEELTNDMTRKLPAVTSVLTGCDPALEMALFSAMLRFGALNLCLRGVPQIAQEHFASVMDAATTGQGIEMSDDQGELEI